MISDTPSKNGLKDRLEYLGKLLIEHKAFDVLPIDVSVYSSAFEGIIVASSMGNRHSKALADHVLEKIKENSMEYLGMEGYQEGEWILLDLNDIIVHVFIEETRKFYNLEGFWTRGKKIELET
ncbi:MAG: ribosome silencing factor [Desulfonatronovibrio sp.]|nr:ribosome silencing factor [Desulfovibrionales bacterium]